MIIRFRVQNFKALRDVTFDLTPLHVLIGPNDSGKSSILQALGALGRSADRPLAQAFTGLWDGRSLVWQGNGDGTVVLSATLAASDELIQYELHVNFASQGREPCRVDEKLSYSEGGFQLWNGRKARTSLFELGESGEMPSGAPAGVSDSLRDAALRTRSALSPVHTYCFDPAQLAMPSALDVKRAFRLDYAGFGLGTCLDDVLSEDRSRFDDLEQRFRKVFPKVRGIKLRLVSGFRTGDGDGRQVPAFHPADAKGVYFDIEGAGDAVPAAQVSSGMLLVLAYLTLLCLPPPYAPRLLLVEEFENGLHPKRLQNVLGVLRDLVGSQSHTQVVLTTHSPYAVDLFKPEEVTLCHKEADGAVALRRLSESNIVRKQIDLFTLGEIWTGEGDDALLQPASK
jgi:energy-coupling factor transporter ATP-binding protein EcfA2